MATALPAIESPRVIEVVDTFTYAGPGIFKTTEVDTAGVDFVSFFLTWHFTTPPNSLISFFAEGRPDNTSQGVLVPLNDAADPLAITSYGEARVTAAALPTVAQFVSSIWVQRTPRYVRLGVSAGSGPTIGTVSVTTFAWSK